MLDDDEKLDEDIRAHVLSLMYVLYEYGLRDVHMGGLLRILGVPDTVAAGFDDKVLGVDADFAKYMNDIRSGRDLSQTLH
jgi:hypothetical protein